MLNRIAVKRSVQKMMKRVLHRSWNTWKAVARENRISKQLLLPNEGNTSCVKPDHLVPSDCDFNTQYLDDSSSIKMNHICRACPLGAICTGETTWFCHCCCCWYWYFDCLLHFSHLNWQFRLLHWQLQWLSCLSLLF